MQFDDPRSRKWAGWVILLRLSVAVLFMFMFAVDGSIPWPWGPPVVAVSLGVGWSAEALCSHLWNQD